MDSLFLTIHGWMTAGGAAAALGSFLWGMVSILVSPCHLASIPLVAGYVGGQGIAVGGRKGAQMALAFTAGLFATITLVGLACALLGRMLGDIGGWWGPLVGAVLVWAGVDMLRSKNCCNGAGSIASRLRLRGLRGAVVLGLAYGTLSGSCTFGFIAPIMAVITVQGNVAGGALLALLFALGHCLPIALVGGSTALATRIVHWSPMSKGAPWLRRGAALVLVLVGMYIALSPFLATPSA